MNEAKLNCAKRRIMTERSEIYFFERSETKRKIDEKQSLGGPMGKEIPFSLKNMKPRNCKLGRKLGKARKGKLTN